MNFNPKYKRMVTIILLIVGLCCAITGIILSKLMKETSLIKNENWFLEKSVEIGQPIMLEDAYIIEVLDDSFVFLYDNMYYEVNGSLEDSYLGVVDIKVENGAITRISAKPAFIEDVLISYSNNTISTKKNGIYNCKENLPIYRIQDNQVTQEDWNKTMIGVSNLKYVLDNGKISAIIITEEDIPSDIRVLIKNGNSIFYDNLFIKIRSNGALIDVTSCFTDNGETSISFEDGFGLEVCDSNGNPLDSPYEGYLHVYKTENGYVLVNELPMETYLKYVVPSEMLSSYGHEALKAQAVCARTYAYSQMYNQSYAAYGANIDDSTAFQAYHNQGRNPECDIAVDETAGEVITCNGELITCYYYSTSPGVTNNMSAWECEDSDYIACSGIEFTNNLNLQIESDFSKFIQQQVECYDSGSSFYRWNSILDISLAKDADKGKLLGLSIKARNEAGYITAIELQYENLTEIIKNEYDIRSILGLYQTEIQLNNGQIRTDIGMVPSACFEVAETSEGKIVLRGGGFGHGIGMSQYGAKTMAEQGNSYKDIIEYYYENVVVEQR